MTAVAPEFSRLVNVGALNHPRTQTIEASGDERLALARRFNLENLTGLTATLTLTPGKKGREVRLSGHFQADLVQICRISLVPLEISLEGPVESIYLVEFKDDFQDDGGHNEAGSELFEPLVDDLIDVGEAVAQAVALEIDPFPQAPDADFTGRGLGGAPPDGPKATGAPTKSPFAVLEKLGKKTDSDPKEKG